MAEDTASRREFIKAVGAGALTTGIGAKLIIPRPLIDRPTEKPWGAGEPAASVIPSAISNAVFDATGVRLRSIPYIPAKMKAAMQGS
jgi:hypothetical protein